MFLIKSKQFRRKAVLLCGLVLMPLWFCSLVIGQATSRDVEISGTVTDCWQGKRYPVRKLRIYVLTMQESERIRVILQGMKGLPPGADRKTTEQFSRAAEELVSATKSLKNQPKMTKTDESGKFAIRGIKTGRKYLVLAISWEVEDEIAYFNYVITDSLKPTPLQLDFYMGPDEKVDCRTEKSPTN